MVSNKFRIAVISLLIFGLIILSIIAYELNGLNDNHRFELNSDGTVVIDTQTGSGYNIHGSRATEIKIK